MGHRQVTTADHRPTGTARATETQTPQTPSWDFSLLGSSCGLSFIYIYMFLGCTGSQVQYAGSSSPTRDQTWLPCTGSAESQPLDHLGRTLGIAGFQSDSFVITSSASNCHQFLPLDSRPWHPGGNTTARHRHTHQVVGVYSPTRRFPSSA